MLIISTKSLQSFFVGGGANPVTVFAGFDPQTLSTAFNVSNLCLAKFSIYSFVNSRIFDYFCSDLPV